MTAEGRTDRAIGITRSLLERAMNDPRTIVHITMYRMTPEAIEDTITDILGYLAKTSPEANKEAEN